MTIKVGGAGDFGGRRVDEAALESESGVFVHLMNWGVTVRDWRVPVEGGQRQVVLGFEDFDPYPEHSPHLGSLAGRVANRIAGGRFSLDGVWYQLDRNEGGNCLHGGSEGLGRQVWEMETDSAANAVCFSHKSPDGAMGFPGNVAFSATYALSGHRLSLEIVGMPDRPTPISLVQHIYFNLGLAGSVLDHRVEMPYSVARTETDDDLVATGVIRPVQGTEFDFRSGRPLRDAAGKPQSFDLNYVLATGRPAEAPVVVASGEDGALGLRLWTDRPGLQFYNSVWTDIAVPGHGGRRYGRHSGLCFEDQMWPDAVNQPHFPDIICTPDRPYRHWCAIEIG